MHRMRSPIGDWTRAIIYDLTAALTEDPKLRRVSLASAGGRIRSWRNSLNVENPIKADRPAESSERRLILSAVSSVANAELEAGLGNDDLADMELRYAEKCLREVWRRQSQPVS